MTPFSFMSFNRRLLPATGAENATFDAQDGFRTPVRTPGSRFNLRGSGVFSELFGSPVSLDVSAEIIALNHRLQKLNGGASAYLNTPGPMTPLSAVRVPAQSGLTPLVANVNAVAQVLGQVGEVIDFLLLHIDELNATHQRVIADLKLTIAELEEQAEGGGILEDCMPGEAVDIVALTNRIRSQLTQEFEAARAQEREVAAQGTARLQELETELAGVAELRLKAAEYDRLQAENWQLRDSHSDARRETLESRQSAKSAQIEAEALDHKLRQAEATIDTLQRQQLEVKARLEATQEQMDGQVSTLEDEIARLRDGLDQAGEDRQSLEEDIAALTTELNELSDRRSSVADRITALKDSNNPSELVQQLEDEFTKEKESLQRSVRRSSQRAAELDGQLAALESERDEDLALVGELQAQLQRQDHRIQKLTQDLNAAESSVEQLKARYEAADAELGSAEAGAERELRQVQEAQLKAKTKEELSQVSQEALDAANQRQADAMAEIVEAAKQYKAQQTKRYNILKQKYEEEIRSHSEQASRQARIARDFENRYHEVRAMLGQAKRELLTTADKAKLKLAHVNGVLRNAKALGDKLPALKKFAEKLQGQDDTEFNGILAGISDLLEGLVAPVDEEGALRSPGVSPIPGSPASETPHRSLPSSPLARATQSVFRNRSRVSDLRRSAMQGARQEARQGVASGEMDESVAHYEPFSSRMARLDSSGNAESPVQQVSARDASHVQQTGARDESYVQEASSPRAEAEAVVDAESPLKADQLTTFKIRSSSAVNSRALSLDFDEHEELEDQVLSSKGELVEVANTFTMQSQFDALLADLEAVGDDPVKFLDLVRKYTRK